MEIWETMADKQEALIIFSLPKISRVLEFLFTSTGEEKEELKNPQTHPFEPASLGFFEGQGWGDFS